MQSRPHYERAIHVLSKDTESTLTLLHSERPKLHRVLAFLSAIGLYSKNEGGGGGGAASQKVCPFALNMHINQPKSLHTEQCHAGPVY